MMAVVTVNKCDIPESVRHMCAMTHSIILSALSYDLLSYCFIYVYLNFYPGTKIVLYFYNISNIC